MKAKFVGWALALFMACIGSADEKNQFSWMSDWIDGCQQVKEKNYSAATVSYTRAIDALSENISDHLYLYNERGLAFASMGQYEKAISDYSNVIEKAQIIDADVVSAWWGRFNSYSELNDLAQCDLHYKTLQEIDVSFPKIGFENDYIVIKTGERLTEKIRKNLAKSMQSVGICEGEDDVLISPSGVCIVKAANFLNKYKPCMSNPVRKDKTNLTYSSIERCKNNCTSVAYYAGLVCTGLPKTCRLICLTTIEPLRRACEWCCNSGDFYRKCVQPLEKFVPIPCDPAWED